MAIDFYELGRQSGAKTAQGQQSGFQSLVSSATKPIEDMLANSKAATAALTAAMPAGVPIEKVPEELRGQVTNFLTENKKSYTDATKVIASGINPQSDRYKNAVETINKVNTRFENLSGNLENIALQRQAALDDPSYSNFTTDEDATTFNNLANGSLYTTMTVNEDGSWNYKDTSGESKAFSEFKINKTGYLGQQAYLGIIEQNAKFKKENRTLVPWDKMLENQTLQIDVVFNKLGPRGVLDYAFSDKQFIEDYAVTKKTTVNDLRKNPEGVAEEYKKYNLLKIKEEYERADGFYEEFDKPIIFGGYRTKRDIDFMNDNITDGKTFTGFDNVRYTFQDGYYYEEDNPETSRNEGETPLSKNEVRSFNQIDNFYNVGSRRKTKANVENNSNNDEAEDFVPEDLVPKDAKIAMQKQLMAIAEGPGSIAQKNERVKEVKKQFREKYPNLTSQ